MAIGLFVLIYKSLSGKNMSSGSLVRIPAWIWRDWRGRDSLGAQGASRDPLAQQGLAVS